MKNALGKWIETSPYSRVEFAKIFGVSAQTVAAWCGKNGIGKMHVNSVSKLTGIPVSSLVVAKKPWLCKPTADAPKWGGCWVE